MFSNISQDEAESNSPIITTPLNSVLGTPTNDILQGTKDNDRLEGYEGNDELLGKLGNDVLDGGIGNDRLYGGEGYDIAVYQNESTSVTVDLSTGIATDKLQNSDTLSEIENIIGSEFGDRIVGDDNVNSLTGRDGNDTLIGGENNDLILGGDGEDVLYGGTGKDSFLYLNFGEGSDKIEDFEVGIDSIRPLMDSLPIEITEEKLSEKHFTIGTKATNREQYLIYNADTGELYFDSDGSGAVIQQLVATFTNTPSLSARDISPL